MERTLGTGNRSHARGALALLSLAVGGAWAAPATPFSPDVLFGEAGEASIVLLTNHFPVAPEDTAGKADEVLERHPWILKLEAQPSERLSIEGILGDRAGLALRLRLLEQSRHGVDLTVGAHELFFAAGEHLFGLTHNGGESEEENQVWVGLARELGPLSVRATVSAMPGGEGTEYVPAVACDLDLPLDLSLGFESILRPEAWQQHVGLSADWKPFQLAFGLSNHQSWLVRDGEFGWHNTAREGSEDGADNPGWWFSLRLPLPSYEPVAHRAPVVEAPKGPVVAGLDSASLARLDRTLLDRQVRADVAELDLRSRLGATDPVQGAVLRRRLLSGGAPSREALWTVALDSSVSAGERRQALATLSDSITLEDLDPLEKLSQDRDPSLRLEAALSIAKVDTPRSRGLLRVLRRDPEESVRTAAESVSAP